MARRTPITSLVQISEINLTPLMDLTFILLITFIITFPLIEQGISVNLPKGKADELMPERAQTVTVDERGNLFLNDIPTTFEELSKHMQALGEIDPGVSVMIRADEKIQYRRVVQVLKILHDAGILKMALVTRAEEDPQP